jgi:hypothetical protein
VLVVLLHPAAPHQLSRQEAGERRVEYLLGVDLPERPHQVRGQRTTPPRDVCASAHHLEVDARELLGVLADVDGDLLRSALPDRDRLVRQVVEILQTPSQFGGGDPQQLGQVPQERILVVHLGAVHGENDGLLVGDQGVPVPIQDLPPWGGDGYHPHSVGLRPASILLGRQDLKEPQAGDQGGEREGDHRGEDSHPPTVGAFRHITTGIPSWAATPR